MITTSIRQRVRDNLNRSDSGIDSKIQDWLNDTKRRLELRRNLDYMWKTSNTSQITNATNTIQISAFTARLKDVLFVKYRTLLPTEDLSWSPLPKVSESETTRIQSYDSPGVVTSGTPAGWDMNDTQITIYPKPLPNYTYGIYLGWYEFSTDWAFTANEEPYLAKWAWQAIINGATSLGFAWTGQLVDADTWDKRWEKALSEFASNDNRRALEGEIGLKPHSGADDPRPSRWRGWQV